MIANSAYRNIRVFLHDFLPLILENNQITYFVDVILPLPLRNQYSYRIPKEFNDHIKVGQRVIVPFGKKKIYAAIVANLHQTAPKEYTAKYIHSILDEEPIVLDYQLKFWTWIQEYYLCHPGDVMISALPAGFKLSSETRVLLNDKFDEEEALSDKEFLILEALQIQSVLDLKQVAEILQIKSVYQYIKSMLTKGVIVLEEEIKNKYKPKIERFLSLSNRMDEKTLQIAFDLLEKKAPKQLYALMNFLKLSQHFSGQSMPVSRSNILKDKGVTGAAINALVKKDILLQYEKEVGRASKYIDEVNDIKGLNADQLTAFDAIKSSFEKKDICLLHGVTSSGKTEIYVKLIQELIEKGKQILYLVPEIALTTQLITRLRKYFGDQVGVYHSGYSQDIRLEIWNDLLNEKFNQYKVIIGPRSAMFLPFKNLELIIVDEEHDSSYKQNNPAPRYHARDTAMVLAKLTKAKVLLGTATPAVETMWNAKQGNYSYVPLMKRYGNSQLPEILIADVKKEYKRRTMTANFSSLLLDNMKLAIEENQQIILFQNRRGYNPMWQCEDCGHVPQCIQCDVSMTYHKYSNILKCHYCGHSKEAAKTCLACGSRKLKMMGFGTEKIENDLKEVFPKLKIGRLDYDTTRKKNAYSQIIGDFESGAIDILVGTQMVTKGLDFERVALVGILNADTMLNRPDFRAFERAFQMMTQVAGRAGRMKDSPRGKVIIQTYQPDHWVIQQVIKNDLNTLINQELLERKNFLYPPFVRIISLDIRHKKPELLDLAAQTLANSLKEKFGHRVLGPEYPYVSKIKNVYHKQIILKIEREASISRAKKLMMHIIDEFLFQKEFKSIRIVTDVDPQ